ncbi:uncharacterized protein BT62DRAFT_1007117 [Guyanagaster necrorhizus]|uniref:Uncharacterized protein n=1 Tax=Guyanagaster necrorhizus TaxID=856835 RepID=A0A9P7VQ68_9AGAR|nr:uncharacterized protein BT62DRAFT_1007117 [Guyanagaster necrorhizus MCA 3950]KAG7445381.1 hypothetical protein BT62DRAFT_1007117 [Guyanagaster necrorhizus MCA 3950]
MKPSQLAVVPSIRPETTSASNCSAWREKRIRDVGVNGLMGLPVQAVFGNMDSFLNETVLNAFCNGVYMGILIISRYGASCGLLPSAFRSDDDK